MKLYDFMMARNCTVALYDITTSKIEFGSVRQVFEDALEQEIAVSQKSIYSTSSL